MAECFLDCFMQAQRFKRIHVFAARFEKHAHWSFLGIHEGLVGSLMHSCTILHYCFAC